MWVDYECKQMEIQMTNPIQTAVEPLKVEAIAKAEQFANQQVERVIKELAEAGNDLEICAPFPKNCYSNDYFNAKANYQLFYSICKTRKGSYSMKEPRFADVNNEYVVRFVTNAKRNAAAQYDAFVAKLIQKIGETIQADLTGNHVWSYSFLNVVKADGSKECWKTHMILNVSKFGKVFNQFPTRKMK